MILYDATGQAVSLYMEPTGCPETSVTNNQRCVTCQKSEEIINSAAGISKRIIEGREVRVESASKGKAIPLEARTGSEGSRRLRLPDFKTVGT